MIQAKANTLIFPPQEKGIELALSAGPEHLRPEGTVYFFTKNGYMTFEAKLTASSIARLTNE